MKLLRMPTACLTALLLLSSGLAHGVTLEIHVVGVDSVPIENAVIYFDHVNTDESSPKNNQATMDQQDKNFIPHLMVVEVGTRVNFSNTDLVNHYVYSFSDAKKFQFKLFKNENNPPSIVFDQPGLITLGCNIHDFMLGYILVVPNRLFGITNKKGLVQISFPDNSKGQLKLWLERANENLELLSQPITLQSANLSLEVKLRKPLKPERRIVHNNNDY